MHEVANIKVPTIGFNTWQVVVQGVSSTSPSEVLQEEDPRGQQSTGTGPGQGHMQQQSLPWAKLAWAVLAGGHVPLKSRARLPIPRGPDNRMSVTRRWLAVLSSMTWQPLSYLSLTLALVLSSQGLTS